MTEPGAAMKCEILQWDTWLDMMPPGPPTLHLSGTARCPQSGYNIKVVRRAPQGINPRDLLLVLQEHSPSAGADVISEIPFDYSELAAAGQFDTVTLSPGGSKKIRIVR